MTTVIEKGVLHGKRFVRFRGERLDWNSGMIRKCDSLIIEGGTVFGYSLRDMGFDGARLSCVIDDPDKGAVATVGRGEVILGDGVRTNVYTEATYHRQKNGVIVTLPADGFLPFVVRVRKIS